MPAYFFFKTIYFDKTFVNIRGHSEFIFCKNKWRAAQKKFITIYNQWWMVNLLIKVEFQFGRRTLDFNPTSYLMCDLIRGDFLTWLWDKIKLRFFFSCSRRSLCNLINLKPHHLKITSILVFFLPKVWTLKNVRWNFHRAKNVPNEFIFHAKLYLAHRIQKTILKLRIWTFK